MKEVVDIGKTIGLKFNGDIANMFNFICTGGNNGISGGGGSSWVCWNKMCLTLPLESFDDNKVLKIVN